MSIEAEHSTANVPPVETTSAEPDNHGRQLGRTVLKAAGYTLAGGILGAGIGAAQGLHETARIDNVAGSTLLVNLDFGNPTNELRLDGALGYRGPGKVRIGGEPIGVKATLETDSHTFFDDKGNFTPRVMQAFAQQFGDSDRIVGRVADTIEHNVVSASTTRGVQGSAIGLLAGGGLLAYRRFATETLEADTIRARKRQIASATLGCISLILAGPPAVSLYRELRPAPMPMLEANPIFDDTPLAGGELFGTLAPPAELAANYYRDYIAPGNKYYGQLVDSVRKAFAAAETLPHDPSLRYIIVAADRHCNIGMDPVLAETAKLAKAGLYISAGDDNFSGTFGFEQGCTDNLGSRLKALKVPAVAVLGNHDSEALTAASERAAGFTVLDDSRVHTVSSISLIGSSDPTRSIFGEGTAPSKLSEQLALLKNQGETLGSEACMSGRVIDFAIIHDPIAAKTAQSTSCGSVRYWIEGHTHVRSGWRYVMNGGVSEGLTLTEGSSGGAMPSSITIGPLRHPAVWDLLAYDVDQHALRADYTFTAQPNGTVTMAKQPLPRPASELPPPEIPEAKATVR